MEIKKMEIKPESASKIRPLDLGKEDQIKEFKTSDKKIDWRMIAAGMAIVIAGVLTGFGLSIVSSKSNKDQMVARTDSLESSSQIKKGGVYGSDSDLFSDKAVGVIEANGKEGEGTHLLLREGGESQTVHLTSSVVDLDLFIGRKVEVYGQTFAAQNVGWLLDVGRVIVLE